MCEVRGHHTTKRSRTVAMSKNKRKWESFRRDLALQGSEVLVDPDGTTNLVARTNAEGVPSEGSSSTREGLIRPYTLALGQQLERLPGIYRVRGGALVPIFAPRDLRSHSEAGCGVVSTSSRAVAPGGPGQRSAQLAAGKLAPQQGRAGSVGRTAEPARRACRYCCAYLPLEACAQHERRCTGR